MSGAVLHGGGVFQAAQVYGGKPAGWLDLSTGLNPCPPVLPLIADRAWHRLPDSELEMAAREAARRFYGSGVGLPLAVPGTQSAIQLLPRLADPKRRIAVFEPTYGEYRRVFELAGFAVDCVTSPTEVDERHMVVIIVNPNNPDGRLYSVEELSELLARLDNFGGYLVIDEAFADNEPAISMAGHSASNLIVFRSFGKFFGLAGIRLGFVISDDGITQQLAAWLGPWPVSGPALSLAAELLSGDTDRLRRKIVERSKAIVDVLTSANLQIEGATPLFKLVRHEEALSLHTHLCRHHILTRKFDIDHQWLRFGLTPDAAADERLKLALDTWRSK